MVRFRVLVLLLLALAGCGGETVPGGTTTTEDRRAAPLEVTTVADGLDTVWALAWDPQGALWFTERGGTLRSSEGAERSIDGVAENGEAGLMGLEIDAAGRFYLMYTSADENRVVELRDDGSQRVLVDGIPAGSIHDGGRIRLGPDGMLYAGIGDAGDGALAQDPGSLNGKILRIDPDSGDAAVFSSGRRNAQGLCFDAAGRLVSTEHGPERGDEVNVVQEGSDGGWPETTGNGIKNYTPTIAPAGCVVYEAELIPQWMGSLLFVTLKDESVRRLTLAEDGTVGDEEVLYQGELGRLRDVAVGPDGAVYLATSNHDGRGRPREGDDKILRIAPRSGG
jgi:glucose/arabinose dehydrogenase